MAIRGKPPEPGVKVGAWRFDNVPQDATRSGWIAGPVHALVCHPSRATKPCRRLLLGGEAECEGCKKQMRAEWLGYVPMRREDGRPLVIAIHEAQFWTCDAIPLGSRVIWGRNKGENEGVWVRPGPDKPTWRSYYPNERPRHNITDYLVLKLWKMPDLYPSIAELWAEECQRAVTDEVPAPVAPVEVPAPEPPSPVKVLEAEIASVALEDTLHRLRRRQAVLKESANGVHPKE